MDTVQLDRIRSARGFFAALDQSGGSTPKALAGYGVPESRYETEAEMFDLVHAMRARVITNPAFDAERVLAAILFEQTMERDVAGKPTARYLWDDKRIVPFLKVDAGLAEEADGVQLMKPIDALDRLLERANEHRIFGTKMRSFVKDADARGVQAVVDQQFEYGERIRAAGLVPILEPEVDLTSPRKAEAEELLHDALRSGVDELPADARIMLKLTIPTTVGRYADLAADERVLGVLALSGGYRRAEACARLREDASMIASFSRALLEGLSDDQGDAEFTETLRTSIDQIYDASVADPAASDRPPTGAD